MLASNHFSRLVEILDPNMIQDRAEALWLLQRLAELSPRRVLEIGTAMGGTAALFATTGAEVITVDIQPQPPYAWERSEYLALVPAPSIRRVIGDSHAFATLEQVRGEYDFIAIDAGHSHEDAGIDFKMYAPLGKVVGFHDIVSNHGEAHWWPKWAWPRIKATGARTLEFTDVVAGGWGLVWLIPEFWTRWREVTND